MALGPLIPEICLVTQFRFPSGRVSAEKYVPVARSASSLLHVRVIDSNAALVPPYTVCPWKPRLDDTDERLIMRPERSLGRNGSAA